MWIPVNVNHLAFGPATPSTAAVPANLSTNYGGPRLMETETTQFFPFGYRCQGYDPIHGFGEFIYLQGIAATAAGTLVNYNPLTGATTVNTGAVANSTPLAWALAPTVANLFGWYQISGSALAINNATAAAGPAYQVSAGANITSTQGNGLQILGGTRILVANGTTFTKTGTTRNGSTEVFFSYLDGVYVGLPISGTGIPGSTTVAAGYNNSPNARNSSAGSATSLNMSAAATADGTVTVTFTRTNFSLVSCNFPFGQGQVA